MVVLLFSLSALIAEVIGTVAGFGSSTVFLPLALLFFDFRTSLVLVALFHIFGTLDRVWLFRKGLDWSLLLRFGVPSVIGSLMGSVLVPVVPQIALKGLLGVFLVSYALWSLFHGTQKIKPTGKNYILGGSISGVGAGLIGTGGVLRGAFLSAFGLVKTKYLAETAAIGFAVDLTRIPVYLAHGFLKPDFYLYIPLLFIIAYVGSYVGKIIVDYIPRHLFNRIIIGSLLVIGTKFIVDWLANSY